MAVASCEGSGREAEVHGQKLVKRGYSYHYKGGTVHCEVCDTYIYLRGSHSVPCAPIPRHQPGESRPHV